MKFKNTEGDGSLDRCLTPPCLPRLKKTKTSRVRKRQAGRVGVNLTELLELQAGSTPRHIPEYTCAGVGTGRGTFPGRIVNTAETFTAQLFHMKQRS